VVITVQKQREELKEFINMLQVGAPSPNTTVAHHRDHHRQVIIAIPMVLIESTRPVGAKLSATDGPAGASPHGQVKIFRMMGAAAGDGNLVRPLCTHGR
jgi:hypothetical protein